MVKLIFVFKNNDVNYKNAIENKNYFDENFVTKIRDHLFEKMFNQKLLSYNNINQVFNFNFVAEKKCSVS